jgi:imidazoleglycerol-phosphate dehydratase/histidinol-phosphatase
VLCYRDEYKQTLGDKRGIRRFGFLLPMDETLARCALDISGRPYLTFKAKFKHHKVGDMSTEMVEHFFRSLAQTMGVTLNLKAQGRNDHHVAEGLFKAFGRTLRDAVKIEGSDLPSSKGVL